MAAGQAEIGVWGLLAPHSFYASYPGAGQHWVAAMGPYDEHLVRDFAAMELGFAVLLACAAIWFERRLVLVAGAAFLAATVPHFAYHLTTTGHAAGRPGRRQPRRLRARAGAWWPAAHGRVARSSRTTTRSALHDKEYLMARLSPPPPAASTRSGG